MKAIMLSIVVAALVVSAAGSAFADPHRDRHRHYRPAPAWGGYSYYAPPPVVYAPPPPPPVASLNFIIPLGGRR